MFVLAWTYSQVAGVWDVIALIRRHCINLGVCSPFIAIVDSRYLKYFRIKWSDITCFRELRNSYVLRIIYPLHCFVFATLLVSVAQFWRTCANTGHEYTNSCLFSDKKTNENKYVWCIITGFCCWVIHKEGNVVIATAKLIQCVIWIGILQNWVMLDSMVLDNMTKWYKQHIFMLCQIKCLAINYLCNFPLF